MNHGVTENASMKRPTVELEEDILAVFNRACEQSKFDVAEHLLRALEVLGATDNDKRSPYLHESVADAYLTITRLYHSKKVNN